MPFTRAQDVRHPTMSSLPRIAASPMTDLRKARDQYLRGEGLPPILRPMVLESWERCRAYGVDPRTLRPQEIDRARLRRA